MDWDFSPSTHFRYAAGRFLAHHRKSPTSRRKAEQIIAMFTKWKIGTNRASSIDTFTASDARAYREFLLTRFSPANVRVHLSTLSGIWNVLLARGEAEINPFDSSACARPESPPTGKRTVPPLNLSEVRRVVDVAVAEQTDAGNRNALAILLIYTLDARPHDLIQLTLGEIRRFIGHGDILASERRSWPWTMPADVRQWISKFGYAFPVFPPVDRGGRVVLSTPIQSATIARLHAAIKRCGERAGLSHPLTTHRIRRAIENAAPSDFTPEIF